MLDNLFYAVIYLTPIINACEYAANMGFIETAVYYAIKDLRSKSCYTANEDSEVIYLTEDHMLESDNISKAK